MMLSSEKTDTLPKVLKVNREKYAARVAMREKKRGGNQ